LAKGESVIRVSREQVNAFRLARHHLSKRSDHLTFASVAGDIAGAQAQVLSAAQMSIWARVRKARVQDLDSAIWKDRKLVRAWCMRRTMFLLPSNELALFARGTARRSEYSLEWAFDQVSSKQLLDKLLDSIQEQLEQPSTRSDIARLLGSQGYRIKFKAGGGWGSTRSVPWVEVGGTLLSVGLLIHALDARDVICSGPNLRNESTYVRADMWVPRWKDMPREEAEELLLAKYLRAFGPATVTDYALWMGLYVKDAKKIWARMDKKISTVDVEGIEAGILEADLEELGNASIEDHVVRLLPNFDTFLLGHKSHRNIIDERGHKKIYRSQGWVSPVVLVDGRALGVWSYKPLKNKELEINVAPFTKFSNDIGSLVRHEALELGEFLGYSNVRTVFEHYS
jgi:Winged helix DNA-binding domain